MPRSIPTLVTVADLARTFDVSEATMRRIMRQHDIHPTARAANVGVFDGKAVARVRHAVNASCAHNADEEVTA